MNPVPAPEAVHVFLAGNPNAGKSTVFNALTGDHQHVANWPGKTVEKKTGTYRQNGTIVHVVDLPGTYSLHARSEDEMIAANELRSGQADVVVAVVDASRLERHLYLVTQLLERRLPIVVALNMTDAAVGGGQIVDVAALSEMLGAPVVPTVATEGIGLDALRAAILERPRHPPGSPPRGLAPTIAAGDPTRMSDVRLAEARYRWIHEGLARCMKYSRPVHRTWGERIDAWLLRPGVGVLIFLATMYFVFQLVVHVSAPFTDWLAATLGGPVSGSIGALLSAIQAPPLAVSAVVDGALAGISGVLAFLPGLILLFLLLAVLEDSGYMARAAVVMDRWMGRAGLHGRSFVPLILGFGCGVPAVYATRGLESRRDRVITGMLVPFMSCSARLPVYLLFAMAFFPREAGLVLWGLYAAGIGVALVTGRILARGAFRGSPRVPLVLELPPLRLPQPRALRSTVVQRTSSFVRQAGTVIVAASAVVWLLTHLPPGAADLRQSWFGRLSSTLAPAFEPSGFGTWEATGALATGFVAKEMVLATLAQVYPHVVLAQQPAAEWSSVLPGLGQAALQAGRELLQTATPGLALFASAPGTPPPALVDGLRTQFDQASALAFLVFVLLYVPCIATLGAIRHEFGSRWALFAVVYQTGVAWILATIVFQLAHALEAL
jgi:ferrous iron transport protein B